MTPNFMTFGGTGDDRSAHKRPKMELAQSDLETIFTVRL